MSQNEKNEKISVRLRRYFPFSERDAVFTLFILGCAAALCVLLRMVDDSDVYVSMIFLLAVVLVSRCTEGYLYGLVASFAGVVCVNYIFTYPYFAFNFTLSGYPITFISMLAVSIIVSAMTTQIKEQEKLHAEAEKERLRGNLLRAVSHDLRTPLTSILGASSTILENDGAITPEKRRELLTEVKEDAEWLIRMVENLLSITRIGSETARITKEYEAVEEIVGESVRKFKKSFSYPPVVVAVPDDLLMVPMDAILIEQVIINLLENAAIHAKNASCIWLSVFCRDSSAVFEVRDNGDGIEKAAFPYLFKGYSMEMDTGRSDKKRSMGIGLSVCMSIVKAHGGLMEAENSPQSGAVFRFTLPVEEEPVL